MEFLQKLATILQIFSGIIVMILVLLQDSKDDGNIITGTNAGGSMGASRDERLAKLTKIFGIIFIFLTIACNTLISINF